ncbi:MAG: hypothetical protein AB8H03_20580 [Saprospiraceae bacterium]
MNFTIDFSKALKGICIVSLLMLLPIIGLQYLGIYGFNPNETISISSVILNQIVYLIPKIIFWWGVFYVSKDQKSSLIGFSIAFVGQVVNTYFLISKGTEINISSLYYWSYLIFPFTSLLVFGWLHFKKTRGLYLGLVAIIISGIGLGMNSYEYYQIIEKLFELIGIEDIVEMRIPSGENSYRIVNPILIFLYQISHPLLFIIFWFVYSAIKREQPFDLSLRTVTLYENADKNIYALVHWILRMAVVMTMIGSLAFMTRLIKQEFDFTILAKSVNFCFSIFFVAALYRNVLLFFYTTKKTYPGFFYVFLNIPYFHFIPWAYLFFIKNRKKTVASSDDILDAYTVEPQTPLLVKAEESQKKFIKEEKNSGLKVLIVIVLIFGAILQITGFNNSMTGFPIENQMLLVLLSFISLALTIWYISYSKALYPIYIIQSIAIIATVIFQNEALMGVTAMAGLVNLLIYYPLFHYDQMKFREGDSEFT